MAIIKVADIRLDGCDYDDSQIENIKEWLGLKEGDLLPTGKIAQLFINHETKCAWAVVATKEATYEIDLPWDEDDIDE